MAEHPSSGRNIHICKEEIYKNFHQYNFDANPGFISGWLKIRDKTEPAKYEQELLKAKLFFYSRMIEKVDKEEYERWIVSYHLKDNKGGCTTGITGSDIETFTHEHGHKEGVDYGDRSMQSNISTIDHKPRRIQMKLDYVNFKDRPNDQYTGPLEENTILCVADNLKQEQKESAYQCRATANGSSFLNGGNCEKACAMSIDGNVLKGGNCEKVSATKNKGNVPKGDSCEKDDVMYNGYTILNGDGCDKSDEMHSDVHIDHDTGMENDYKERDSASKHPLSFLELINLLEKGCKISGIEELNVKPTNENPTPSVLDRKRKPWEQ